MLAVETDLMIKRIASQDKQIQRLPCLVIFFPEFEIALLILLRQLVLPNPRFYRCNQVICAGILKQLIEIDNVRDLIIRVNSISIDIDSYIQSAGKQIHEILDAGREAWNDIVQYFVFSPCIIHRAFNV